MSALTLLKAATLSEICDGIVLPAPGRKALFVLAGYGSALRDNFSLAEPQDFSLRVRMSGDERNYELEPLTFRCFPKAGTVDVDLTKATLYRLNTEKHDYFRIFLVCKDEAFAQAFEAQFTPIAFDAAAAKDWRLENALEWCATEPRAQSEELQPITGIKMPDKLRWRLRKPVFRVSEHRVLYQWELCSLTDGPYERPLITCVTDNEGEVARPADLLPVRLMFAKLAAPPSPAAAPASAVTAAPRPETPPAAAPPTITAAPAPPVRPTRALPTKPPEKVVPAYRRQALEERMRAAGEAEMAKIRKLFEMPD